MSSRISTKAATSRFLDYMVVTNKHGVLWIAACLKSGDWLYERGEIVFETTLSPAEMKAFKYVGWL